MSGWVLLVWILPMSLVLTVVVTAIVRNEKKRRFAGRSPMPPEEVYAQYYAESDVPRRVVLDTFARVADVLNDIPVALLRPSDRFDKELAVAVDPVFDDSLAMLQHEFRLELQDYRPPGKEQIETLDDLVRAVAAHEARRNQEGSRRKPVPEPPV